MPKKSATTRGAAQRNKPKAQKSFEVVRQTVAEPTPVELADEEQPEAVAISSVPAPLPEVQTRATKTATRAAVATPEVETVAESDIALTPAPASDENEKITPAVKGNSASARLAARRGQKAQQQRTATTLITAEHYGYVRRDLMIIAVLASIMFVAIIVLYFTIGRGL